MTMYVHHTFDFKKLLRKHFVVRCDSKQTSNMMSRRQHNIWPTYADVHNTYSCWLVRFGCVIKTFQLMTNHSRPFDWDFDIKGALSRGFDIATSKTNMATKRTKKQQPTSEKPSKLTKTDSTALTLATLPSLSPTNSFQDLLQWVDEVDAVDTPQINDDGNENRKSSYTLGHCQDRVMNVTPNEVTIMSTWSSSMLTDGHILSRCWHKLMRTRRSWTASPARWRIVNTSVMVTTYL